jgi:hypothetical protein
MEIRSYRRVFDLERRIYSVDTLRLNPAGVPVRGLVYLAVLVVATLALAHLPLSGWVFARAPWYLSELALPALAASVLAMLRLGGRAIHLTGRALLGLWTGPRRLTRLQPCAAAPRAWRPPEILLLPDGSDSRMRRLRYTGPGAALVMCEHELGRPGRLRARLGSARRSLSVRPAAGARHLEDGKVIVLAPRARLLVARRHPREAGDG